MVVPGVLRRGAIPGPRRSRLGGHPLRHVGRRGGVGAPEPGAVRVAGLPGQQPGLPLEGRLPAQARHAEPCRHRRAAAAPHLPGRARPRPEPPLQGLLRQRRQRRPVSRTLARRLSLDLPARQGHPQRRHFPAHLRRLQRPLRRDSQTADGVGPLRLADPQRRFRGVVGARPRPSHRRDRPGEPPRADPQGRRGPGLPLAAPRRRGDRLHCAALQDALHAVRGAVRGPSRCCSTRRGSTCRR